MRTIVIKVLLFVVSCGAVCTTGMAQEFETDRTVVSKSFRGISLSPATQQIDQALRTSASVVFHETRMAAVLDEFQQEHGITILTHESARDFGMDDDSLVTATFTDIPLSSVLANILEPWDCRLAIHHDVLKVVSNDTADQWMECRIYDCTSLLDRIQSGTYEDNMIQVQRVLFESVDPDSWIENGGGGRLAELSGKLVITQSLENHIAIEQLLTALDGEFAR